MGILKKYLKTKPICKVTFILTKNTVDQSNKVAVVGDFNAWNPCKHIINKKGWVFKFSINLKLGHEYQFCYLYDDCYWGDEPEADKHIINPYGNAENSVIIT